MLHKPQGATGLVVLGIWMASLGPLGCSRRPAASEAKETLEGASQSVAEVTLASVEKARISSELTVTGVVAALPNRDVKVSALVPGRIAGMMVAEGDRIGQGQVLAKIDDRPLLEQVSQAEAPVVQARANLENARLNRDRNENLFQRGIAARKDLEDARTQFSVSEAALRQAEAALALLRLQLSRTEIRSPISGTVVKRFLSVGEQVDGTAAQPILEVANLSQVELLANVPAVYLGKIRIGQTLSISAPNFSGELMGRVVAISPAVDPATNVGLVRIRIANPNAVLRLGMFLETRVSLETHANALVVPPKAVYRDEKGEAIVFRVQGDMAEAVPIKLGIENQGRVEVLSGVQAGDAVILDGGYGLGQRAKVKIKP